jgi:hypothetical protein
VTARASLDVILRPNLVGLPHRQAQFDSTFHGTAFFAKGRESSLSGQGSHRRRVGLDDHMSSIFLRYAIASGRFLAPRHILSGPRLSTELSTPLASPGMVWRHPEWLDHAGEA